MHSFVHRVCVCVWERKRQGHIMVESAVLIGPCVQTYLVSWHLCTLVHFLARREIHTNKYTNKLTSNNINMLGKLKTNAFEH